MEYFAITYLNIAIACRTYRIIENTDNYIPMLRYSRWPLMSLLHAQQIKLEYIREIWRH